MGYYIDITESDIFLDKKHFDDVYFKMCELNDYHDLKRGGGNWSHDESDSGSRYPKNKWFSWMPYNYPEICTTMEEILDQLGFELLFDSDGNLTGLYYSNKIGNEDYFLACLAGHVKDGSYIEFLGEEPNDYWRYVFKNGKMERHHGKVTVDFQYAETYEFGQLTEGDKAIAEYVKNSIKNLPSLQDGSD